MNYLISLIVSLLLTEEAGAQNFADTTLYNNEFKWTIVIPEGFTTVNADSVNAMRSRGVQLIEKSYDQKVQDNTTNIFMFKTNQFNYFESCSQPFDTVSDGNYIKSVKAVAGVLYNTFATQMKGIEIDTLFEVEKISGLEFQKFSLQLKFPNNIIFYVKMYTYLFGNKEFVVNIYYTDEIKGYQMLSAFRRSTFLK